MTHNNKKFTIIEMLGVLVVIMILMTLGTITVMQIQERVRINAQFAEILSLKNSFKGYQVTSTENTVGSQQKLSLGAIMEKESILDVKRAPFNDKTKHDDFFLSVFGTKITVEVAKVSVLKKEKDIVPLLKSITGQEFLTKDFEFYYGTHDEDGGEDGAKFGLKGEPGVNRYWYRLKFKTSEEPDAPEYERTFTL